MTTPLSHSNATDILLAHDRWATHALIRACIPLTDLQFHQSFHIGLGTLHDTIAHIVAVIDIWSDVLARRPRQPSYIDDQRSTPDQLSEALDRACDEFARIINSGSPADQFSRESRDATYHFTRADTLSHVTTHNMYHRAQGINMLRLLGIADLPKTSVMTWTLENPFGAST